MFGIVYYSILNLKRKRKGNSYVKTKYRAEIKGLYE